MKTRREFFKTLAGSMVIVAACVVASKSLMAVPKQTKLENYYKALDSGKANKDWIPQPYSHVTSGYAQVSDLEPIIKDIETVHCTASGASIRDSDGLTRFYWTKGV